MGLSTAERNRRKRERKKKSRKDNRLEEAAGAGQEEHGGIEKNLESDDIEIEYIVEPIIAMKSPEAGSATSDAADGQSVSETMQEVLRKYHERANISLVVTDDELGDNSDDNQDMESPAEHDDDDEDDEAALLSKRKWRELTRPTVAELKRRVRRPDLVDAHDITAADPDFLIELKSVPGTVPVPRHWGRKRKYLQGKRGFEKAPFQLPDFIVKTGITDIRDTVAEDEADSSAKQKNRGRVAPKMGAMDVDYKVLHEAFFQHQTKPEGLTKFGDLYYEGKELETTSGMKPGGVLSKALREALGMVSETSPPPYLLNMQRYGPPPSYTHLLIPGLNASLPNEKCQYGFHSGGWGKPPVDAYGSPLYGGNPFDPAGTKVNGDSHTALVTSSGSTLIQQYWGGLPLGNSTGQNADSNAEDSENEESDSDDDDEMDESVDSDASDDEQEKKEGADGDAPINLRKETAGDETSLDPAHQAPKQLYTVLKETKSTTNAESSSVFNSQVQYVLPSEGGPAAATPEVEGAESVIVKPASDGKKKKSKRNPDEDASELGKDFKF